MKEFRKSLLATALMAVGISSAHAAAPAIAWPCVEDQVLAGGITTCSNKFVMLDAAGGVTGANSPVQFKWDGTYKVVDDGVTDGSTANAALGVEFGTTFFGYTWTAHNVKVYSNVGSPYSFHVGAYPNVVVGVNQVAITMLFDWNGSSNIPVVEICERGSTGGIFSGADLTIWDCVSVDGNGDGIRGIGMATIPFQNSNANFNLMGLVPPTGPGALYGTVSETIRATAITGGGGGGGCAMDPAGRDASLLLALLGGLGYTSWRRRRG